MLLKLKSSSCISPNVKVILYYNLTFIKTKLYSIFSDLSRMALPKINANKLASTQIANREVTDGLHTFIITHNLDVMQRKWNKFNEVKRFNTHTMH